MIANLWPVITSTSKPGIEMPNPWILPSSAPEEWFKDLPVGNVTVFWLERMKFCEMILWPLVDPSRLVFRLLVSTSRILICGFF